MRSGLITGSVPVSAYRSFLIPAASGCPQKSIRHPVPYGVSIIGRSLSFRLLLTTLSRRFDL
jgi:hypothetical protein